MISLVARHGAGSKHVRARCSMDALCLTTDDGVMYSPTAFRITDRETLARFMAQYNFALLVSQTPEGLLTTHLPFLLERDGDCDRLLGHVARANAHWKHFDGKNEAAVIFQGPHGYVSPSWYAT